MRISQIMFDKTNLNVKKISPKIEIKSKKINKFPLE